MLRSVTCISIFIPRLQAASFRALSRTFTFSAFLNARSPPPHPVKIKHKLGIKKSKTEKVLKSGMTHRGFKDAVRSLGFEANAKDLSDLNIPALSSESLSRLKDKVVTYDPEADKHIELLGGYKKYQHHEIFSKHCSMVTDNTVNIQDTFVKSLSGSSDRNRIYLRGIKGVGKSTLLCQAQALALSEYNGDVVLLHFDEPELFVRGYSDYYLNSKLDLYHQPMFTKRWIKRFREVNANVLQKMQLLEDVAFSNRRSSFEYKKGKNNLYEYVVNCHDFGVMGSTGAFQFLIEHLKFYSEKYPVLFSVDNINAIFELPYTKYFHKDYTPIHYSQFEVGDLIKRLMSGVLVFSKGGVLVAESSDFGQSRTLKVGLSLEALDPYAEDLNHEEALSMMKNGGITTFSLVNLNKNQARNLMDFWSKSEALNTRDYPSKPVYTRIEDVSPGSKVYKVGEFVNQMDPAEVYEKNLQRTYFISGGNPGLFLKNNFLTF